MLRTAIARTVLLLITWSAFGPAPSMAEDPPEDAERPSPSVYDQEVILKPLDGSAAVPLASFRGKKLLVVNVASKCGNTPQYADLQALVEKHGSKVVVLGFPSNEFGKQEPGTHEEIAAFCRANYGVTFPMFAKTSVKKGEDQHPLYRWLTDPDANGWNDKAPRWNFSKYLIDEHGHLREVFGAKVRPMSDEVLAAVAD